MVGFLFCFFFLRENLFACRQQCVLKIKMNKNEEEETRTHFSIQKYVDIIALLLFYVFLFRSVSFSVGRIVKCVQRTRETKIKKKNIIST